MILCTCYNLTFAHSFLFFFTFLGRFLTRFLAHFWEVLGRFLAGLGQASRGKTRLKTQKRKIIEKTSFYFFYFPYFSKKEFTFFRVCEQMQVMISLGKGGVEGRAEREGRGGGSFPFL